MILRLAIVCCVGGSFLGCGDSVTPETCDGSCPHDAQTRVDGGTEADAPVTMPVCPAAIPTVGDRCAQSAAPYTCFDDRRFTCICRCFDVGCFWTACDSA